MHHEKKVSKARRSAHFFGAVRNLLATRYAARRIGRRPGYCSGVLPPRARFFSGDRGLVLWNSVAGERYPHGVSVCPGRAGLTRGHAEALFGRVSTTGVRAGGVPTQKGCMAYPRAREFHSRCPEQAGESFTYAIRNE